MTHRDAYRLVLDDLTDVYTVRHMDQIHDHAVRLLKGKFSIDNVREMMQVDHGVKPHVALVIVAAALADLERTRDRAT